MGAFLSFLVADPIGFDIVVPACVHDEALEHVRDIAGITEGLSPVLGEVFAQFAVEVVGGE